MTRGGNNDPSAVVSKRPAATRGSASLFRLRSVPLAWDNLPHPVPPDLPPMHSIAPILERLRNAKGKSLALLPLYQAEENKPLWAESPRLFHGFARALLRDGHPTRAFELSREGLKAHPG